MQWRVVTASEKMRKKPCAACRAMEQQAVYLARLVCLVARFDLGDRAPQINGIKVYQGDRIEDEVNLEIDVMWSGKQARPFALGCRPAMIAGHKTARQHAHRPAGHA